MDPSIQTDDIEEMSRLTQKLDSVKLPADLHEKASTMIKRVQLVLKYGGQLSAIDQVTNYIDWITNLPWEKRSEDKLDINHAKEILDHNHYGLQEIKDRILEYLSVMKLNMQTPLTFEQTDHIMRAPILFFVGLVGTGKTTIAKSIADAMERSFVRIPFGGLGSALDLRGQSRVHPDAEVGLVMKALRRAETKNPVILLDELDRVADHARADIMGVLVELLDPGQNMAFTDHYIDYPFDVSQVLFIATANNTGNIATAVMDRLEPIQMPSYTDDEKTIIGKTYVFAKIRKDAGLSESQLQIDENIWPLIVRPLGFDSGIRTLERTINGICRKVARNLIEGKGTSFHLTAENIKQFLPSW